MPYNPNEPQNGETINADPIRGQFNALNDRITALPVSQPESDPVVGAVTGIVKADGAGHIAAANIGAGPGNAGVNSALVTEILVPGSRPRWCHPET